MNLPTITRISDFSQSPIVTLFLLVAFVFLCLFIGHNRLYIQNTIKIIFATKKQNLVANEERSASAIFLRFCGNFVAIISVTGFILLAEQLQNAVIFDTTSGVFEAHFNRCWIILTAVVAWFLFKHLTFKIWSANISSDETVLIFKRTYFSIFIFLGTLLYPFLLVATYAPFQWQMPTLVVMFVIICLSTICIIIKLFQYFFTRRNNLFYIFLYLCGLEIIPILLLRKLVFSLFKIV